MILFLNQKFLKIVFLIFFIVAPNFAFTQKVDEQIEFILNHTNQDSTRVKQLFQLAFTQYKNDVDAYIKCNVQIKKISSEIHYKKGIGYSNFLEGLINLNTSSFSESISSFQKSIKIFEKSKDSKMKLEAYFYLGIAMNYNLQYRATIKLLTPFINKYKDQKQFQKVIGEMRMCLGASYLRLNEYANAIKYYKSAIKTFEKINYNYGIVQASSEIGLLYQKRKDYKNAIQYFERCEEVMRTKKCGTLVTKGIIKYFKSRTYINLRKYKEAQIANEQSFEIHKKIKKESMYFLYYKLNIEILFAQKKYLDVITFGNKYLVDFKDNPSFVFDLNYRIGVSYASLKKWAKAEEKLEQAKFDSDNMVIGSEIKHVQVLDALSNVYESQGKINKAFELLKISSSNKIKELENEKKTNLNQLLVKFEVVNKELLIKRNELENHRKLLIIEKQKFYFKILYITLFFVVLFLVIFIRLYVLKRIKNKRITQQKELIQKFNEDLSTSLKEKEILLNEIHHRVKNNLQLVMSLINLQAIENNSIETFIEKTRSRIQSMAVIHENLYKAENFSEINFKKYVQELFYFEQKAFQKPNQNVKLIIDSPDVSFDVNISIPLGLILNEVICNAFKYAFPSMNEGLIEVVLTITESKKEGLLIIQDNGIGVNKTETDFENTLSQGIQLIKLLTEQLNGEITISFQNGTRFEIRFSLESR